jgi:hypothetical protein
MEGELEIATKREAVCAGEIWARGLFDSVIKVQDLQPF